MVGPCGPNRQVPDYAAFARQLEACSRQLAERAAATGDDSLNQTARQLRHRAAEIRENLHGAAEPSCPVRSGFFDLQPCAIRADDADPRARGQVGAHDRP